MAAGENDIRAHREIHQLQDDKPSIKENHTLLLLRHGHTKREVDLTHTGRQQARQWADCLVGTQVTKSYTSPLKHRELLPASEIP
ncbi:histidine phosphatase family protein [Desulfosalsimonas propionicica]|uniref:histidine phosphatase family protein n=1 Tax=Desulfosalsimonas propionicica TaxID=332175 RepID=UPI00338FF0EE